MTGFERLWTGWRSTYVSSIPSASAGAGPADGSDAAEALGSVFTQILRSGASDTESNIVHRGVHVFAILNAYPYGTGHTLVLPYREVADLEALEPDEALELWRTVTDAVCAVKAAYRPDGVNVGLNLGRPAGGSIAEHLHVHVVPRWTGDANFMTTVANTRTLPEPLEDTARKLRSAWPVG
jgi:ATP adenylyltransferase